MSYKHMQPETKLHYRMYKDGKNWVFAAVALAFFGVGAMTTTVHADNVPAAEQSAIEKPASAPASQATSATASQTSAGSEKASTASESTSVASSAKSDVASNSGAVKSTTNEDESGATSTASVAKSDAKVSDQQSQDSANGSSSVKSDAQAVTSVASQASQTSQVSQGVQSVTSQASQESQVDSSASVNGSSTKSQGTTQIASIAKATALNFLANDPATSTDPTDSTKATNGNQTSSNASDATNSDDVKSNDSVDTDGKTINIHSDNFDKYFKTNGDATYIGGVVQLTDGKSQSGNITLRNQIDPSAGFKVIGGISMTSPAPDPDNPGQVTDADGISFIFHPGGTDQVGGKGGALGIADLPNAFGFKVDTYFNGDDTDVHSDFLPDPTLDRTGQKISGGEAYGAFVHTDASGVAATYGGPEGIDYHPEYEANAKFGIHIAGAPTTHVDDTGEYIDPKTGVNTTTDQSAGALLVRTPTQLNGKEVPIEIDYAPVQQFDANGNPLVDAAGNNVFKHIMTVKYGTQGVADNDTTNQPLKEWTLDITPWLTSDGKGGYEPLSFAMAASSGNFFNIQGMKYEGFSYTSKAAINVKYEDEDGNNLLPEVTNHYSIGDQYAYSNPEIEGFHYDRTVERNYVLNDGKTIAEDQTVENAAGYAKVLNPDIVFVYARNVPNKTFLQVIPMSVGDGKSPANIGKQIFTDGQSNALDVPEIPGYTLLQSANKDKYSDASAEYDYSLQGNTATFAIQKDQLNSFKVWYVPSTVTYTVIPFDVNDPKKTSLDTEGTLANIPVQFGLKDKPIVLPIIPGYVPVDAHPLSWSFTDIDAGTNLPKTSYQIPVAYEVAPSIRLNYTAATKSTTTTINVDENKKVDSDSKTVVSDVSASLGVMTYVKSDIRPEISSNVTVNVPSLQQELISNKKDITASDFVKLNDGSPSSYTYTLTGQQSHDVAYQAKAAPLKVTFEDENKKSLFETQIDGGTVLGSYSVTAPKVISVDKVKYVLQGKNLQEGTYNDSQNQGITFDYVRQSVVAGQDVDIMVNDKDYTGEQNFVSVTDSQGKTSSTDDVALEHAAYETVSVDTSKVDITKPGIYPVTITTKDGASTTVYTHVVEIDLRDLTLYVGDTWTESDNFVGGTTAENTQMTFDMLKLVSGRISTDYKSDKQKVVFEYGDPVYVTAYVTVLDRPIVTTPSKPSKPSEGTETPDTKPAQPVTGDKTPVTTPEQPATTPETPATAPERPATTPEVPVTTPEQPSTVAETPTPVDQPTTPAQTPDVPAEQTTPTEPTQPATVANVTPNVPTQPVLTPTATDQPTTPVSSDRPWDPIELLMTDDDNGQIITTTEIQGYTGNWVYIGNMIPAGYHLAPGQSDWILLNDVTPQTVHLVANTVDQTSTAVATQNTVASVATTQTVAPVAQQSIPATIVKETSAPTTKTTDETDQSAVAELPHTGELATTAAMGTGLALLTGLLSLFGFRRKQH
ncbi:lectin-like domain-containing protein [Furfurilactobacillus rossiae]|uniref:lectin-like domain-containing protein n=1 Tax=Furfurilactobacillus rossiae TaxID=231049 RepID=UPI001F388E9D|nr:KxYKxGKxW signal peptide domain-containing protein [Furfurilactobacillus rossiae]MCF6166186.1 KxYKxGKxW signal peptide domain-containing protein [Furfurilactobacillus rossiae]